MTRPPQSVFNNISGRLECCQQSGGETTSCVAHLASPQPPAPAFCTFPLPINCRYQLHSNGNGLTLEVDAGSGKVQCSLSVFIFITILFLRRSLSVQLSSLGGIGQSSASSSWKPGSLDLVGRQRSSSDPPNMHPPVPPMRLTSTGGMDPNKPTLPS